MKRDCSHALDLIAQRTRAPLRPNEAAWLDSHLAWCRGCQAAEADQRAVEHLLGAWPRLPADPERGVAAVRARIASESARGSGGSQLRLALAVGTLVAAALATLVIAHRRHPVSPQTAERPTLATAAPESPPVTGERVLRPLKGRRASKPDPGAFAGAIPEPAPERTHRARTRRERQSGPSAALAHVGSHPGRDAGAAGGTAAVMSAEEAGELERFFLLPPPGNPSVSVFVMAPGDDASSRPAPVTEVLAEEMWERIALAREAAQDGLAQTQQEPPCPAPPPYEAGPARPFRSEALNKGGWG